MRRRRTHLWGIGIFDVTAPVIAKITIESYVVSVKFIMLPCAAAGTDDSDTHISLRSLHSCWKE